MNILSSCHPRYFYDSYKRLCVIIDIQYKITGRENKHSPGRSTSYSTKVTLDMFSLVACLNSCVVRSGPNKVVGGSKVICYDPIKVIIQQSVNVVLQLFLIVILGGKKDLAKR